MPPINLWNYSVTRDWFDDSSWLRLHSRETANRVGAARALQKKPSDFMRNR